MLNSTEIPLNIPIGSMYAIYGNMDPINIPPMLAYIPYMDPMGFLDQGEGGLMILTFGLTPHFVSLNPPLKGGLKMQSVQVKSQVAWMKTIFFEVDLG